jgi:hypothetical protein
MLIHPRKLYCLPGMNCHKVLFVRPFFPMQNKSLSTLLYANYRILLREEHFQHGGNSESLTHAWVGSGFQSLISKKF